MIVFPRARSLLSRETTSEEKEMNEVRSIDTVVIGAGQVGLTTGYFLKKQGREFVILDAGDRVGDAWRKRWDSLRLFTPSRYDGLPGMRFPLPSATYPTKDQMADYLEEYAKRFELPIMLNTRVESLVRKGDCFEVRAGALTFEADNVIVAMANHQAPRIPPFAKDLDPSIFQMHSLEYRNSSQLEPGSVLEVSRSHSTMMSGKESGHIPFRIDTPIARYLLTRIVRFVFLHVLSLKSPIGRKARPKILSKGAPLVRVKPKDLVAAGVERVVRIGGVKNGRPVTEDGRVLEVNNVIWCTGYRPGFSWIDLPILGERQEPIHERGVVSSEPGLYFVGLHFLYSLGSETLPGHKRDAKYVVDHLARHRPLVATAKLSGAAI
jgi:putative flavoprotein involved in K+ transport